MPLHLLAGVLILGVIVMFSSCKEDDSPSCVQCTADTTIPFEVCRENNGNASVNGEDTGTNYDMYVSGLEEAGVTCGR